MPPSNASGCSPGAMHCMSHSGTSADGPADSAKSWQPMIDDLSTARRVNRFAVRCLPHVWQEARWRSVPVRHRLFLAGRPACHNQYRHVTHLSTNHACCLSGTQYLNASSRLRYHSLPSDQHLRTAVLTSTKHQPPGLHTVDPYSLELRAAAGPQQYPHMRGCSRCTNIAHAAHLSHNQQSLQCLSCSS